MKHLLDIKQKFSQILFTSQPSQSSSSPGCKFEKRIDEGLSHDRKETGGRMGSCFLLLLFCFVFFFFSLVCFSQANLKCLVYNPGT